MSGKIACIKAVRNMFGIGLKDAKDIVDGAAILPQVVDVDNFIEPEPKVGWRPPQVVEPFRPKLNPWDLDDYFFARLNHMKAERAFHKAENRLNVAGDAYASIRDRITYKGWLKVHYDPNTRLPYMTCTKDRYKTKGGETK